ncbi:MAG: amidohydrolase family protein [Candidatus Woesearchaeota archaeon]
MKKIIIDIHTHIGKDIDGEKYSLKDLKKSMKKWGILKSVVFPFNTSDEKLIIESKKLLKISKKDNSIIPFLRFNPKNITSNDLISLLNLGFFGVKLHPSAQKFVLDDKKLYKVYEIINSYNIPILFHTNAQDLKYSNPIKILNIAKKFPNLKIIIAHFFGNDLSLIEKFKGFKSIYVDISINSRTLRIEQAVNVGIKLVFGSDAPYDSQGISKLKIEESNISRKQKNKIFYNNAKELLNLK